MGHLVGQREQPPAREVNRDVSGDLSELIDKLLQKDPLQRPQSADEVVEDLLGDNLRRDDEADGGTVAGGRRKSGIAGWFGRGGKATPR